jgi:hypothetical protein
MKSGGKRPRFRFTCSLKRFVGTPYRAARSLSSNTLWPRSIRIDRAMCSIGMSCGLVGHVSTSCGTLCHRAFLSSTASSARIACSMRSNATPANMPACSLSSTWLDEQTSASSAAPAFCNRPPLPAVVDTTIVVARSRCDLASRLQTSRQFECILKMSLPALCFSGKPGRRLRPWQRVRLQARSGSTREGVLCRSIYWLNWRWQSQR